LRWLTPTATVDDSTAPTSTWTDSATRDADGTTSAWTDADTVDATAADTSWDDSELLDVFGVVNFAELAGFRLGNMLRHVLPGAEFPDVNYNFVVLIGAFPLGDFTAVEGIEYRADLFDIKEGGRNFSPVMLPWGGPNKRGELTLKWGTVVWTTLYDWINDVEVGGSFRREVFVIQLSRDGFPTRLMRFGNCWPIAWKGAELDTQNSNWTMESLTLAYERFNMLLLRGLTTIL
jgi:phage tail-like protein